jgi:adenine deaminase
MNKVEELQKLISVAKGETPADLILANACVVNTFSGEVEKAGVAIYDGVIAGVGEYRLAKEVIDLNGKHLAPGLINGHTHLESSMLDVGQYAQAVVPHGTSAIVTDLHEIANVCGIRGIEYVLDSARRLPFDLFLMAPSCVPATRLETSGASVTADDIKKLLRYHNCIGLGEVMDYPGVLTGHKTVLKKIISAHGRHVDGHAPGVRGKNLNAYIAAGMSSDHESVSLGEAVEKLRRGMYVMIREGSTEKNLEDLLPLVTHKTYQRCLFVVDDRNGADIFHDGDIDAVVRKAIRLGLDPVRAIQMATINAATYFQLDKLGAIGPGYDANLIVIDSLPDFRVDMVFHHGRLVARGGRPLFSLPQANGNKLAHTVNIKQFTIDALRLRARGETLPVIEVMPGQIITRKKLMKMNTADGFVLTDTSEDILKAVVVERHKASGRTGIGMVTGFGFKKGALASSIAHDAHNIVAIGVNDDDIFAAIKEVERMQGGLVAAANGQVLASLATPVAGLLSTDSPGDVAAGLEKLERAASDLGGKLPSPFAVLSFLALPVIPELRLTDFGLVDVNEAKLLKY